MKLIAVNQRGACKDFIDLKFIMENIGLTLKVLLQDFGRKYAVGEEMLFQLPPLRIHNSVDIMAEFYVIQSLS